MTLFITHTNITTFQTMFKPKYGTVHRVYHDPITKLTTDTRLNENQICFDSTAEYQLYLQLDALFPSSDFSLHCHQPVTVGGIQWKIDFKVSALETSAVGMYQLAEIANCINGSHFAHLKDLHFEYKGLQDGNFIKKMSNLVTASPTFAKTLILVSSHVGAFGTYDFNRKQFYCHPIITQNILRMSISTMKNAIIYNGGNQ